MDLQELRVIVKLAETRSFTRAAALLGITQPAVSHQVKKLEDELGVALVLRESRQVTPTYAGELLIDYARRILGLVDEAQNAIAEVNGGAAGRVTLAAIGTTTVYVLPEILYQFRTAHPGIQIILRTLGAEEIEQMVDTGEADLGIVGSHISTAGFTSIPILHDPVIPVVHRNHPFAATGATRLQDLAREPLILFGGWKNWTEYVLSLFRGAGYNPRVDLQVDSIEAVKRMVAWGLGFTLIPAIAADREILVGDLVALKLEDAPPMERQIVLIYKRGRRLPVAAQLFAEAICDACRIKEAASPSVPQGPGALGTT